jgi:hypothetical protein
MPERTAIRAPSDLIVVRDGVEYPAPGSWSIPAQMLDLRTGSGWARRSRPSLVQGSLDVGDETTLELETVDDPTAPSDGARFRFRGVLVAGDRLGRWRFEGDASSAGTVHRLTVGVAYGGVHRSGANALTWLVVTGAVVGREGRRRRDERRRVVRDLTGGLNALLDRSSSGAGPAR